MQIGLDASRANNDQKSGVEWYAHHLIRQLMKIDSENQYFLYTDKPLEAALKPSVNNFKEAYLKWPLARFWTLGRLTLETVFKRPDVLFVPSHTFPLIGGKKNVITWHDVGYERYPETYTKWELKSLKQGARRAIKLADKIITVSNYTKKELTRIYKAKPEKIEVVYHGLNHSRYYPIPKESVKSYLQEINVSLPYFIYLGRLALRKNIVGLIRMYNRFREKVKQPHNLILVGSSSSWQSEIEAEIKLSPYKNEIKKLGWLPTEKLPILLSGARGAVFPSFYEGFCLPMIEAMACGCPVIASTSSSLPEISGGAAELIDAHDIENFAEAMKKITEDDEFRQSLVNKGLNRAGDFSWDKCAKQTLEVLNNL